MQSTNYDKQQYEKMNFIKEQEFQNGIAKHRFSIEYAICESGRGLRRSKAEPKPRPASEMRQRRVERFANCF